MATEKTTKRTTTVPRKVAVETMTYEKARRLLDKEGYSRLVIVRRDEKDPRKIINITLHEAM